MSILETFYLLFKADTSDLKKGAEDAEKTTKKLDDSLQSIGKGSQKVGQSFLELARAAAGILGVSAAAYKVLSGVSEAARISNELGQAS